VIRFCHCLGVAVVVCDPHHPQQNGFVERYHRSYQEECLSRHRPTTLEQVHEVTQSFGEHYNWQRPHQGLACGNRPPRVAFPALPPLLKVPDMVNADAWLSQVDGEHLVRLVNRKADGEGGCTPLLRFEHVSRTSGELTRQCRRAVLAGRVSASETQPIATQRALSAQLFLSGLCRAHATGGFDASLVCLPCSDALASVGLLLPNTMLRNRAAHEVGKSYKSGRKKRSFTCRKSQAQRAAA
jgi:hypothetical protein